MEPTICVATALAVSAMPLLLLRFSAHSKVLHPLNVFGSVDGNVSVREMKAEESFQSHRDGRGDRT